MITNSKTLEYKTFLFRENDYGRALILDEKRINESVDFIKKHNILGLEINYTLGYSSKSLSCLSLFSENIKHIRIVNHTVEVSGLYNLKNLITLELGDESKQSIDFSFFKFLKRCFFSWRKGSESIFECNKLTHLGIEKFPFSDLTKIEVFKELVYLGIGNSKIESLNTSIKLLSLKEISLSYLRGLDSLDGLSYFPNLNKLDLYNINSLINIKGVINCLELNFLSIEKCKLISDLSYLSTLKELKVLYLDNCGSIKSLKPLENLMKLDELHFIENTDILDGDLQFLLNKRIKSLYFRDRRHYSHKRKELIEN